MYGGAQIAGSVAGYFLYNYVGNGGGYGEARSVCGHVVDMACVARFC